MVSRAKSLAFCPNLYLLWRALSRRRAALPLPHLVTRPNHRRVARPARRRRARVDGDVCGLPAVDARTRLAHRPPYLRPPFPPPSHPSLLPATLPSSLPPLLTLSWAACLTSLQAPSPSPWCTFFCRFCTTSSFSLHPIRLFTLLLLSSFLPPFRASPPFLHLLPLRICHLAACYRLPLGDRAPPSSTHSAPSPSSSSSLSLYFPHPLTSSSASLLFLSAAAGSSADYLIPIPPPLLSPHICSIATPFPRWGLFSLLPLLLCTSALTRLLPYLLSHPFLSQSPLPSLPLPPLAPLLLANGPPLFFAPLLGFRYRITVATLVLLSPLVLVLWPLPSV
ncbi:unnamed protein product [Closterium sp. Naga37s-1]|nr:unnamed protein product [Closterium sp. Naga37s-1]